MKVISYYKDFNSMYFQKENFLKPYILSKILGVECEIHYGETQDVKPLPKEYKGVKLKKYGVKGQGGLQFIIIAWIIIKNYKEISALVTFHHSRNTTFLVLLLKFLNPKASIWVSGDVEYDYVDSVVKNNFGFDRGHRGKLLFYLYDRFYKSIDVYSVETTRCYEAFKPLFNKYKWDSLLYLPCGVDSDSLETVCPRTECPKEDIIISVGRFGSYQKNTEMLLEGLSHADLGSWVVYLIGPITADFSLKEDNNFKKFIENFYKQRPDLKDKVIFTGPIFDEAKLNLFFQRSKIFIMTSRHEAFANVFAQARWHGCHIVSTDVGGASDMSYNWKYGTKIEQENPRDLSNKLNHILNSEINFPPKHFSEQISYEYLLKYQLLPMFRENR